MKEIERIIRLNESEETLSLPAQAACQGVAGAFSHKACLQAFEQPDIRFYPTFEEVFQAVSSGERLYGVIPIENTLAGSVTDNYDLMLRYHLFIVGSVTVKIEHSLLTLPGSKLEDLRQVYSHEQALHQCSDFFKANPQLTATPYSNRRDNFTRFVILARQSVLDPACGRISLVVRVQHKAGALYAALSRFAEQKINLLKLESRPIPDSPFEFLFYWDFAGNMAQEHVQRALGALAGDIDYFQFLGNYPELSEL